MTFTDDSDRANFIGSYADEYDPAPDFEGMEYDDWHKTPKCGGPRYPDSESQYAVAANAGCPGCRHCFPPDFEAIHTGFETWDRPDFWRARSTQNMLADIGYALRPHPIDCPNGWACFLRTIGFDARLHRAANCKLASICERAETHADALEEYKSWAKNAARKVEEIAARKSLPIPSPNLRAAA